MDGLRGRLFAALVLVIGSAMLFGCATAGAGRGEWETSYDPVDLDGQVKSGRLKKRVESFILILDASGSMADPYNGTPKINIAKSIVSQMNQTIPELDYDAGLRTFGRKSTIGEADSQLLFGISTFSRSGLSKTLDDLDIPRGESPLYKAVRGSTDDLRHSAGKKAVIIVSDGYEYDLDREEALKAAKIMKGWFGDDVCIYTVLVGENAGSKDFLGKIAGIGGCGFSVSADNIDSREGMSDFVKRVFLSSVSEARAPAPLPPPLDPAKARGVSDSDYDGVPDFADRCPGTPLTAKVDKNGCWEIEHVLFDFDRSKLKPEFHPVLDEVVRVMQRNPGLEMVIEGHTDSVGAERYNEGLSERRAKAVKSYIEKSGVSSPRLTIRGYGFSRPVSTNQTDEGRAKNRRTELYPAQ